MTQVQGFNDKVGFIWQVADLLRGDLKPHEYGQVILPLTVLRRLDSVLAPTKQAVIDRAASLEGKIDNLEPLLLKAADQPFYNISPLDFPRLLDDANNIASNLRTYILGFSRGAVEVLDKYGFDHTITRLDNAGLLFQVVGAFAEIDLHPDVVPNDAMGYIFEELLRKFSEMSNETAGEHFTPREVIQLMVNLLFAEDDDALRGQAPIRTMFDCACGTGGMLTGGQEHLADLNPNARLEVFGQELNGETWAIARSDMMIKGQDPSNIRLGNSLSDDQFEDRTFDYLIANPPYGVDWKRMERQIKDEHEQLGEQGRFAAGLPRVSDGSLLFLLHLVSKMRPAKDGGGRIAIVLSGSPLTVGDAGSGESAIREWLLEQDLVEAVIALPDELFYNTGIGTYVWILSNRKKPERRHRVLLLDGRESWVRLRQPLGEKRKRITAEQISELTRLYSGEFSDERRSVTVDLDDFLYTRYPVQYPVPVRYQVSANAIKAALEALSEQANALSGLDLAGFEATSVDEVAERLTALLPDNATIADSGLYRVATDLAWASEVTRWTSRASGSSRREYEYLGRGLDPRAWLEHNVLPLAPGARIETKKARGGAEIPFTRYFITEPPKVESLKALDDLRAEAERAMQDEEDSL